MRQITSFFNLNEPDVRTMLFKADTNNDGFIDYTEFITAAFDKSKLLSEENIQSAFSLLDSNGDGTISVDELRAAFDNTTIA